MLNVKIEWQQAGQDGPAIVATWEGARYVFKQGATGYKRKGNWQTGRLIKVDASYLLKQLIKKLKKQGATIVYVNKPEGVNL